MVGSFCVRVVTVVVARAAIGLVLYGLFFLIVFELVLLLCLFSHHNCVRRVRLVCLVCVRERQTDREGGGMGAAGGEEGENIIFTYIQTQKICMYTHKNCSI